MKKNRGVRERRGERESGRFTVNEGQDEKKKYERGVGIKGERREIF